MTNVQRLYYGDPRLSELLQAIVDTVYERGDGIPVAAILGCLDLAKDAIKKDQE